MDLSTFIRQQVPYRLSASAAFESAVSSEIELGGLGSAIVYGPVVARYSTGDGTLCFYCKGVEYTSSEQNIDCHYQDLDFLAPDTYDKSKMRSVALRLGTASVNVGLSEPMDAQRIAQLVLDIQRALPVLAI